MRLLSWLFRARWPRPGDLIRLNGKFFMVVLVEQSASGLGRAELEPLGAVLSRTFAVIEGDQPMLLFDALIKAGWEPPLVDQRREMKVGS